MGLGEGLLAAQFQVASLERLRLRGMPQAFRIELESLGLLLAALVYVPQGLVDLRHTGRIAVQHLQVFRFRLGVIALHLVGLAIAVMQFGPEREIGAGVIQNVIAAPEGLVQKIVPV